MTKCDSCETEMVLMTEKIRAIFKSRKQVPYTKGEVCPLCEGLQ